jgi:hypothetical protein
MISCRRGFTRTYVTAGQEFTSRRGAGEEPAAIPRSTAAATAESSAVVSHEIELQNLRRAGEIEGVAWDEHADELLVLSNRGARILQGMPIGYYPGYDREVHEVYVFHARGAAR